MKGAGLVVVAVLLLVVGLVHGSLLASSRVERCVRDGASDVPNISCDRRMIVTLTVDSGQNNTEQLELVLDKTEDEDGVVRTLEHPMQIRWAKSIPKLLYPITYVGRTNNKPYETVIYKDSILFLFDECNDSPGSSSPTCGWFYNQDGTVVRDSQGFCCSCDLSEVLWLSNEQTRAGLTCSLFGFGVDASSAHCLRFDPLWYDVFSIGPAQVSFEVLLSLSKYQTSVDAYGNATGGYVTEVIRLSPSQTTGTGDGGNVFAKLQGDFAPWSDNPVLSEKYLFVPSAPTTHPRVRGGTDYWMLVDRSAADFSGLTCNKIGVSFSAFRYQGSACGNWPQACLSNQLEDYHQEDLKKWEKGQLGRYFVRFWGDFVNNEAVIMSNDQRYLAFALDQIRATVTTLTLNADDIIYTVNRSPGRIVSANITGFEGLATHGELDVVVLNNGSVNADYMITVTQCGDRIQPVLAKMRSIEARQPASVSFQLYSLTNAAFNTGCNVSLFDSLGVIVDSVWVNVTVYATNVSCLGGQCNSGGGGDPADGSYGYKVNSCDSCNSIFDIVCYVDNSCTSKIMVFVVMIIIFLCCCSCCCVCLKSKRGRAAFMSCVKGMCCMACLPMKAVPSTGNVRTSRKKKRKAKLKQKKKKIDKKLQKMQEKMAKKQNELKKAKYKKKLDRMNRRTSTLTEALKTRAYRDDDFEISDSSNSSNSGSDDDRRGSAPNQPGGRRRDAERAQRHGRSRSAHDTIGERLDRHRSMSVDRMSPPREEQRDDRRRAGDKKTWNWSEMMRKGLRSLHSRNDSVRMKDTDLIKMAKRSATAYFNIESSLPSGLVSPGPQFSVRGRLILLEEGIDVWFNFSIERQHQLQSRYMEREGDYRDLERPIALPRAYYQTLIGLDNARRFITDDPIFPCINE